LTNNDEIRRQWTYFFIYKSFSCIPFTFFSSFIVVSLTYRTFVDAIDYIYRRILFKKQWDQLNLEKNDEKDSFCCNLFDLNDDNEIIFCKHDVQYVIDLFESKNDLTNTKKSKKASEYNFTVGKVETNNVGRKILNGKRLIILFNWVVNNPYEKLLFLG
jgi:hypothetical protein